MLLLHMLLLHIGVSMTATGRVVGSEWFRMSDEGLLGCPLYRRRWLLLKCAGNQITERGAAYRASGRRVHLVTEPSEAGSTAPLGVGLEK
jgi:hypothetical protein